MNKSIGTTMMIAMLSFGVGCTGENDADLDGNVSTASTGEVTTETGLDPDYCPPSTTSTTTPSGAWATAMPTIAAMGGTAVVSATWEDGTTFTADLTISLDTTTVFVQSYVDPVDCPDEWAWFVDATIDVVGSPSSTTSNVQVLRDSTVAPDLLPWEFQGVLQLNSADATKASAIVGYTVTEANYYGAWDTNGLFVFGLTAVPPGSTGVDDEDSLASM